MTKYFVRWYLDFGGRYFIERSSTGIVIRDRWLFKNSDVFETYPSERGKRLTILMTYKTAREAIAKLKSLGLKLSAPEKMIGFTGNPTYCYKDLSRS